MKRSFFQNILCTLLTIFAVMAFGVAYAAAAVDAGIDDAGVAADATVAVDADAVDAGAAKQKATSKEPADSKPTKEAPGPFVVPKDLPRPARVVAIELHGEVNQGMAAFVDRVAKHLKKGDLLLVDIKTFGGRVDAAVEIRDTLLHTHDVGARTVAYVNPRAISAGALITYATDVIVVAPGATMGAATPIQIGTGGQAKPVAEKFVSYMRQEMRSTARARGRRGDVAEAMVDADTEVAGLSPKGKLLTVDGADALKWGIASFEADTRAAALTQLGYDKLGKTHTLKPINTSWAERIASWLSSSTVSGLLMTVGMLGLMIGLYTGGSPLPLGLGAICLLLFFFGHYVTQLAGVEDILLFILGVALIGAEAFLPGTFVFGTIGVILVIASLFLGLVDFEKVPWHVQWEIGLVSSALTVVFGSFLATVVLAALSARYLPQTGLGKRFVLASAISGNATDKQTQATADLLIGKTGIVLSDLRPAGRVLIEGRRYDARSQVGFIAAKAAVQVVKRWGIELIVAEVPLEQAAASDVAIRDEETEGASREG